MSDGWEVEAYWPRHEPPSTRERRGDDLSRFGPKRYGYRLARDGWPPPGVWACPRCRRVAQRPYDARVGYCPACGDYTKARTSNAR